MRKQLDILGTARTVVHKPAVERMRLVLEAMAAATARAEKPFAENTNRTYERERIRYAEWCDFIDQDPFPLSETVLIGYLEWLSRQPTKLGDTTAPSTVRMAMAALCTLDRWQRTTPENPNPRSLAEYPVVNRWLTSWGRDNPIAPRKQAPAVARPQLLRILDTIREPTPGAAPGPYRLRYLRDRAMWLVGIGAAMRVDDIARVLLCDVQVLDRGLYIRMRRRKTNQSGKLDHVGVEWARTLELCPVTAWMEWARARLELGELGELGSSGPAFVAIGRDGTLGSTKRKKAPSDHLDTRTVQRILQETAARASVHVSGHTLRRTLAQRANELNHHQDAIQRQGGWKRADSMAPYFNIEDVWKDNVTRGLFDVEPIHVTPPHAKLLRDGHTEAAAQDDARRDRAGS